VKDYNAEFHSQSVLEGVLELRSAHPIQSREIQRIHVDIFDVAYHIIGGGEEGDKREVRTKEEADHNLPYMIAAALLDGNVSPAQYAPERIIRADVQELLRKVSIRPDKSLSQRFPAEMPCRIQIELKDGRLIEIEKQDYEGFFKRPLTWEKAVAKFKRLSAPFTAPDQQSALIQTVEQLEELEVSDLTRLLGDDLDNSAQKNHKNYRKIDA
jgi:2-methylcitrate dehydratase